MINVTSSYLQGNRHESVTKAFKPIQAAYIGDAMAEKGLVLQSLQSGRALHPDKADFQRTLARYRGPEIGDGLFLDVIYESKHMGRGADRLMLGIYRLICQNGLFVGKSFFAQSINHKGDAYGRLEDSLTAALSQKDALARQIERLQQVRMGSSEVASFVRQAVGLVVPNSAPLHNSALTVIRREEDRELTAWNTFNVIQENMMRGGSVSWIVPVTDKRTGIVSTRVMTNRAIRPNTGKDASINQALFDIALSFAA